MCNRVVIATIQVLESELLHIDGMPDIVCPHHPTLKDGIVRSTVSLKVGSSDCCSYSSCSSGACFWYSSDASLKSMCTSLPQHATKQRIT